MAWPLVTKIVVSILSICILILIYQAIKRILERRVRVHAVLQEHAIVLTKTMRWILVVAIFIDLILIWANVENFWITITGILGVVAIGFFAVWSVLSNIVAGLIILWSKHVNIGDSLEILPEKIKGRVQDVTIMFVYLDAGKGDKIQVPNNLFFQKFVRIHKK